VAHPRVMFFPQRPLKPEEAVYILAHQANPRTDQMLNDRSVGAFADPDAEVEGGVAPLPSAEQSANSAGTSGWSATVTPGGNSGTAPSADPGAQSTSTEKIPELTPEQQKIRDLEAQLAAAKAPQPEPEPVLTPEQLKIKELEAQLAATKTAKPRGRPRTQPVGPPTTAPTQAGNGTVATLPANDEPPTTPVGNDISNRIAGLVKKNPA